MFNIPKVISLGPLIIPLPLLLLIIIGISMSYVVLYQNRNWKFTIEPWTEILLNGFVIYILIWKFSYILLDPLGILHQPKLLLLANGGLMGLILGALGSLIGMYYFARKKGFPFPLFLDLSTYWVLLSFTTYWLIVRSYGLPTSVPWGISFEESMVTYHPIHFYQALIGFSILLFLLKIKKISFGEGLFTGYSLLLTGLGLLFMSNFAFHSQVLSGLAPLQWFYLSLLLIGIVFIASRHSRKKSSVAR